MELLLILFLLLECTIDIKKDLIRKAKGMIKEPLFLKKSGNIYSLMIPNNGVLEFKNGEEAIIACTSDKKKNFLEISMKCQGL